VFVCVCVCAVCVCVFVCVCVLCVCVCVCVCGAANEAIVTRRAARQYNRICNKWTSSWRWYAVSIGTYLTSFLGNRAASTVENPVATDCGNFRSHDEHLGQWVMCTVYRMAQKALDTAPLLWNAECQVSFAPPCIVLLTSSWKPSIFFTPPPLQVFSWFRTGTPSFIEMLTSVNFAFFFVAISVMKWWYNLTSRRGQCWLTPRCSSFTQRGHAQFIVFVSPCLCIPSHPPFVYP